MGVVVVDGGVGDDVWSLAPTLCQILPNNASHSPGCIWRPWLGTLVLVSLQGVSVLYFPNSAIPCLPLFSPAGLAVK